MRGIVIIRRTRTLLLLMPIIGLALTNGHASTVSREEAIPLAKAALEEKVGIEADTIRLASATAAEWPDSSLGCPEKGMSYQPVLTPGYVVSLQVNSRTYTVHVAGEAAVICNKAGMTFQETSNARTEQAMQPVNAAREDLAARLNVPPGQVKVVAFKRSTWPDVSLDCPQPGETYAEIETPGFVIELEQGGKTYRYHASMNDLRLCETANADSDNR
jgi:hypothetical protein